jgi:hypothetical protein
LLWILNFFYEVKCNFKKTKQKLHHVVTKIYM